jgi:hypothetical protein
MDVEERFMFHMMIQDKSAQNSCAAFTTACTACRFRPGCAQQPRIITSPKRLFAFGAALEDSSNSRDDVSAIAWVEGLRKSTQHANKR